MSLQENIEMIVNRSSHEKLFIFLVLFSFWHGSNFNIIISIIKPSFLLGPLLIFVSFFYIFSFKDKFSFYLNASVLLFILYTTIFILTGYDSLRYIDFFYFMGIFPISVAMRLSLNSNGNVVFLYRTIVTLVLFSFIILLMEFFTSIRLVERPSSLLLGATFNNPNDLATVFLVFYCVTSFLGNVINVSLLKKCILFLVFLLSISLTMSRTVLFVFVVVSLLIFASKNIFRFAIVSISTVFLFLLYFSAFESILIFLKGSSNELISENADRLWLALYSFSNDKSIESRSDIYKFFIDNYDFFHLGYGIKNYDGFFNSASLISLAKINPHSLLIDLSLSFGFLGLLFYLFPIFAFSVYFFKNCIKNDTRGFALFLISFMLVYISTSFVPSSIYRLPIYFSPVFFFLYACEVRFLESFIYIRYGQSRGDRGCNSSNY